MPSGPSYHQLTVKRVKRETGLASSFVLVPERGEDDLFKYKSGQFLTFRIPHEAGQITRSYSLSSAPAADPDMTICVKRIEDGRGSIWFNDNAIAGMRIEATQPAGRFVLTDANTPLFLIAGGSGITPCISLVKEALMTTDRKIKLVYANQDQKSVIYHSELELLAKRFSGRFECQYWFDEESGFMVAEDIHTASRGWETSEVYICGPGPLMELAEAALEERLGRAARILTEKFVSPEDDVQETRDQEPAGNAGLVHLTLDGEVHEFPCSAGQTILEAALAAGIDAPNSCVEGHCGTCMALLKAGDVSMSSTQALSKRNIERGFVLACQSRITSEEQVWLDFDL